MASDVMSLFGLDPSIIQQQQNQGAVDQASRMNPYFAAGAAGGQLMGSAANSAFGLQTPEMAQAQQVQDSMQGADLTTAAGMRAAASKFIMMGQYAQGMALHSKASEMEASNVTASNLQEDRNLGNSRDVTIGMTEPTAENMFKSTPIKHSITVYPKTGKVEDATQGITFDSKAEWIESLKKLNKQGKAPEVATAAGILEGLKPNPDGSFDAAAITGTQQSAQVQNQQNAATQNNIDFYRDKLANMNLPIGSPQTAQIERLLNAELLKLSQNQGTTY